MNLGREETGLTMKQRINFKELLKLLKLQSKKIAGKLNINSSAFSDCVREKGKKSFTEAAFDSLKIELEAQLKREEKRLRAAEKWDFANNLYKSIFTDSIAEGLSYCGPKDGTPISQAATDYIQRPVDQKLIRSLKKGAPHLIYILGGIQSGCTSVCSGLDELSQRQDFKVASVDFRAITKFVPSKGEGLTTMSLIELVVTAITNKGLDLGDPSDPLAMVTASSKCSNALNRWHSEMNYSPSQHVVIHLDHFSSLNELSKNRHQLDNLFLFISALVPSIRWLTMLVNISPELWSDPKMSIYRSRATELFVEHFDEEYIMSLCEVSLPEQSLDMHEITQYCLDTFGPFPYTSGLVVDTIKTKIEAGTPNDEAIAECKREFNSLIEAINANDPKIDLASYQHYQSLKGLLNRIDAALNQIIDYSTATIKESSTGLTKILLDGRGHELPVPIGHALIELGLTNKSIYLHPLPSMVAKNRVA